MKIFKRKHSFRAISIIILVFGILIPVIFTNTFFFNEISKEYNEDHKSAIALNAKSLNYSLDQYLDKYSLVFDVVSDSAVWDKIIDVNSTLTKQEVKDLYTQISLGNDVLAYEDYADDYQSLISLISSYEADESIKSIYIGTPDSYVFTNEIGDTNTVIYQLVGDESSDFDCTTRPWYTGAIAKGNDIYWTPPYLDKDGETIVLSGSKTIYDQEGNLVGVISMDINIDHFTEEILQFEFDDKYSRCIIDLEGNFIFAQVDKLDSNIENSELITWLSSDEEFIEIDGIVYTKINNGESGWYIIQSFSQEQIDLDMRNLLGSAWAYGLIIVILIVLISYFQSGLLLKPIKILTGHFKKIEDQKDLSIMLPESNVTKINEFGLLFTSVENMQKSVRDSMEQVEYLSYYDQLTEINNRSFFEKALQRLNKEKYLPLSIVMIDVNGLKLINDTYGHHAGDELLKSTGSALKENTRPSDVVSRWGGDEFVLLLPNTELKNAKIIIERIKATASEIDFEYGDISLAIGVATKVDKSEDSSEVFKLAEQIMYQEKNNVESSIRSETINTIINTLFEKSPETKEHSTRVSELATEIAKSMGLPENIVNDIKTIGTIHDIGKIVVDTSILDKIDPLTKEERQIIKNHSLIGSRILSSTHEYTRLAPGVLHHHERIDGKGYPDQLKGDQIPLESRIISVADAFDAMISHRPYKDKALTIDEAVEEIKKHSGTQFDEEIAKVFVEKVVYKFFE